MSFPIVTSQPYLNEIAFFRARQPRVQIQPFIILRKHDTTRQVTDSQSGTDLPRVKPLPKACKPSLSGSLQKFDLWPLESLRTLSRRKKTKQKHDKITTKTLKTNTSLRARVSSAPGDGGQTLFETFLIKLFVVILFYLVSKLPTLQRFLLLFVSRGKILTARHHTQRWSPISSRVFQFLRSSTLRPAALLTSAQAWKVSAPLNTEQLG